jgi:acetyl-CoA carboxylase biotin carboxyl carrier protein
MPRHEVVSPVPGIFYRRPDPDSDPFKAEGDEVAEGDTIGLVEIMKNFQEVEADVAGKLAEYAVENEEEVEAGQTIAAVESDE